MSLKLGAKDLFPYLGDYRPVNIYKGENKIAGWKWLEQSGEELYFENTYNDFVDVEIDGKSVQEGEPSPDNPIEIHSLSDFDVVSSVGKRNLLVGRENGNLRLNSNSNSVQPIIYKSYEDYDSVTQIGGNSLSTYAGEFTTFMLEKDKEYTDSMYVYSPVKIDLSIKGYSGDVWTTVPSNTWTRLNRTIIGTGEKQRLPSLYSKNAEALNHEIFYNRIKLEEGEISSYSPAPEDITGNTNHPLIDKINLLLSEPLRSVGDVKDRLFRDSDGLWKIERNIEPIHPEYGTRTIEETYSVLDSPIYEVLPQDYQDKLNNLRSFQDSNYVYTTGSIEPQLIGKAKVKDV